jgi:hypothetical protein
VAESKGSPFSPPSHSPFAGYPEAVDLAFGRYAKYGTIIKEYRNAIMTYTPSEMVGAKREGKFGISQREERTINAFSETQRGGVLEKNGTSRRFRFRFDNPLLQPYVIMKGLADDMLDGELRQLLERKRR